MKVGWVLIGDINTPSSRIMGINANNWLQNSGVVSHILDGYMMAYDYDTIIFQKIYYPEVQELAKDLKLRGKEIIYIIDDLYPEGIPIAQIADKVVCGSEYIKSWIRPYTQAKLFTIDDAYETPREFCKTEYTNSEMPVVSWFGTLLHFQQAEELRPLIESLGFKYVTISACPDATKQWNLDTIWNELIESDIIVIPYLGELPPFELAKGNNRCSQAMVLGLPVIASPIPAYLSIVRQGKNGFITRTNTLEEWEIYLKLLKNWRLRKVIGKQAREDVIDRYNIDQIGIEWIKILEEDIC